MAAAAAPTQIRYFEARDPMRISLVSERPGIVTIDLHGSSFDYSGFGWAQEKIQALGQQISDLLKGDRRDAKHLDMCTALKSHASTIPSPFLSQVVQAVEAVRAKYGETTFASRRFSDAGHTFRILGPEAILKQEETVSAVANKVKEFLQISEFLEAMEKFPLPPNLLPADIKCKIVARKEQLAQELYALCEKTGLQVLKGPKPTTGCC